MRRLPPPETVTFPFQEPDPREASPYDPDPYDTDPYSEF
jgi:hypothetical protein